MDGLKIVHCADMHLDSSFVRFGLRDSGAAVRAAEIRAAFARIVDLARVEDTDILLIAGDFFEHDCVKKPTIRFVIDQIEKKIPDVPVFIAPGNHDPKTRASYYSTTDWPENVTIFGPEWQTVEIPGKNAFVHGWGHDRPHVKERRLAELRIPASDAVHVVLIHGADDTNAFGPSEYLPFNRDECLASGADYVAVGHIHRFGVVAERPDGEGWLAAYPGSPESLDFGQKSDHGVIAGTVGKDGNDLRLLQVGHREHFSLEVDVTRADTEEQVVERITGVAPEADRQKHLYRLTLTGEIDPALELDAEALESVLAGGFHYVELTDATRPAWDLHEIAWQNTLAGRFTKEMLAQLGASGEDERGEIELAIRHGLRALEGRR